MDLVFIKFCVCNVKFQCLSGTHRNRRMLIVSVGLSSKPSSILFVKIKNIYNLDSTKRWDNN